MSLLLGLMAAAAILIFVALQFHKPWTIVMAAMVCTAVSAYSLQQGAWPIAMIEAIWVIVVLRKGRPSSRDIWML